MMANANKICIALLTFALFFGASATAFADSITVRIQSIAASKSDTHMDPELDGSITRKLERAFAGYTSFKRVADTTFSLVPKGKKTTELVNGSALTVRYHGLTGKLIKLALGISGKVSTTLRASRGSTFFQAGLRYGDGILILAISVK